MLGRQPLDNKLAQTLPLRLLAHLGDAVLHLYEREREILTAASPRQLHDRSAMRVSASSQARFLDSISQLLSEDEQDIVRRARNLKATGYRKASQSDYRKATALEALVGYLYLTDTSRLLQILQEPGADESPASSAKP